MIEQALYSVLSASSAITTLIGSRIYPVIIPEDTTLPALSYWFVSGTASPTMDTRGTIRSRVQLDCWGQTYSDAVTLRAAVIQAIAGHRDSSFSAQIVSVHDEFIEDALQYRAVLEAYLFASL